LQTDLQLVAAGADFTFNTSHKFVPASRLSTWYFADFTAAIFLQLTNMNE
jgi:hypothetical protein